MSYHRHTHTWMCVCLCCRYEQVCVRLPLRVSVRVWMSHCCTVWALCDAFGTGSRWFVDSSLYVNRAASSGSAGQTEGRKTKGRRVDGTTELSWLSATCGSWATSVSNFIYRIIDLLWKTKYFFIAWWISLGGTMINEWMFGVESCGSLSWCENMQKYTQKSVYWITLHIQCKL